MNVRNGTAASPPERSQSVSADVRLLVHLDIADEVNRAPEDEHGAIYDFEGPRRRRNRRPYTDDEVLEAIKAWARMFGRAPTSTDWNPAARRRLAKKLLSNARWHLRTARYFEEGSWPSVQTVRLRFGSMNSALKAAGFEPRSPGRQPRDGVPVDAVRVDANEITRAEIASDDRFRHLVRRILEAKKVGDADAQRALWYELAEVAVALGDRIEIPKEVLDAA